MTQPYQFIAHTEQDTERLASALAALLPDGTTIALVGTLGAGKTRFTQALAAALGVPRDMVTSPTFVLCHEYRGAKPIYHMDAYRIADDDEFLQLGSEEYFESAGITLVEWADRVAACLPPQRIEIRIEVLGDTSRGFQIDAQGDNLQQVIQRLKVAMDCCPPAE